MPFLDCGRVSLTVQVVGPSHTAASLLGAAIVVRFPDIYGPRLGVTIATYQVALTIAGSTGGSDEQIGNVRLFDHPDTRTGLSPTNGSTR